MVYASALIPPPHAAVIILIVTASSLSSSLVSPLSLGAFHLSFSTVSSTLRNEYCVLRRRERRVQQRHFGIAQKCSGRQCDLSLTSLFFEEERIILHNDNDKTNSNAKTISSSIPQQFAQIYQTLISSPISYSIIKSHSIISQLQSSGFTNDDDIYQFAVGFVTSNRQELISRILIDDFAWPVMDAHIARVGISAMIMSMLSSSVGSTSKQEQITISSNSSDEQPPGNNNNNNSTQREEVMIDDNIIVPITSTTNLSAATSLIEQSASVPWKSVHVNDGAKIRRAKTTSSPSSSSPSSSSSSSLTTSQKDSYAAGYNYGMTNNITDSTTYSTLSHELTEYYNYMTLQRDNHVVIRDQTAKVYMTHARLFLGWIVDARGVLLDDDERKILDQVVGVGRGREVDQEVVISLQQQQTSSPMKTNIVQCVRKVMWTNVLHRISSLSSTSSLTNPMLEHEDNKERMRLQHQSLKRSLSLYDIFPNPTAESVSPILQYVLWLRTERGISQNYEANILRGMIKLVKFRFANDNNYDGGGGGGNTNTINTIPQQQQSSSSRRSSLMMTSSLDDLPVVLELRKLHRDAGNKGKKAPRSSDEDKKWLDWTDYLKVIRLLKSDLSEMIKTYDEKTRLFDNGLLLVGKENDIENAAAAPAVTKGKEEEVISGKKMRQRQSSSDAARAATTKSLQVLRHEIAKTYQQYLILSFFACIPDRQRTFRELELGKNFFKVDTNDGSTITATTGSATSSSCSSSMWIIKHTADDYKTGATYGERPSLPLTVSLTHEIDDFIERWRPSLLRTSSSSSSSTSTTSSSSPSHLFLQPRTGNPLTANSVYQIVSRCCYKYKQKKTNPHLLRDMIVTHIRQNSDASEKELEALALFMGHSIQMQRNSYDRRTLGQKVSPAIKLMHDMNDAVLRESK